MTTAVTLDSKTVLESIAVRIIEEQEKIIGPVAIEQAKGVNGLNMSLWTNKSHRVQIVGNQSEVINKLVEQYSELFGMLSIEVCKSASSDLISDLSEDQVPEILV